VIPLNISMMTRQVLVCSVHDIFRAFITTCECGTVMFSVAPVCLSVRNAFESFDISDTIHSCARSEVTEVQMREVDLLFEYILTRDGQAALHCWFPKSDVQMTVNYVCTV